LTTSRGQVTNEVRMPATPPDTASFQPGVRVWRMVLAGVVLGEGIVRGTKSGDGEGEGGCDEIVGDATAGEGAMKKVVVVRGL
jgi:hypothetical protein